MSDARRTPSVETLRAEFDRSFARAPALAPRDEIALLAIRAGGDRIALRALEIAGLLQARAIVRVPSARAELLGVCGVRGAVLPVYGLARLLRLPEDAAPPRWMALAGPPERRVVLAFDALEGHAVVRAGELQRAAAADMAATHVAEIAQLGERAVRVASVPSMLRAITGD